MPPLCLLPLGMVQHLQTPPWGISLQGWQLSAGAADCRQGITEHSPNSPQRFPGLRCGQMGHLPTPPSQTPPTARQPPEVKSKPSF